jgi:DNA-binding MltR family transcriptional regulator
MKIDQSIVDDQNVLEEEFKLDSDRGAAIVGASYLDEILRVIIIGYLVDDTKKNDKELFSGNGPLSSFSARINLCYRFGLISESERKILHGVRGIRNEFAHKLSGASFEDDNIRQRCLNLSVPREMLMPDFIPIPRDKNETAPLPTITKADETNPRAIYQEAVKHIAGQLRGRQYYSMANKVQKAEDFNSPTAPGRQYLEVQEALFKRYSETAKKAKEKGMDVEPDEDLVHRLDVMNRTQKYILDQADKAHAKNKYN